MGSKVEFRALISKITLLSKLILTNIGIKSVTGQTKVIPHTIFETAPIWTFSLYFRE